MNNICTVVVVVFTFPVSLCLLLCSQSMSPTQTHLHFITRGYTDVWRCEITHSTSPHPAPAKLSCGNGFPEIVSLTWDHRSAWVSVWEMQLCRVPCLDSVCFGATTNPHKPFGRGGVISFWKLLAPIYLLRVYPGINAAP